MKATRLGLLLAAPCALASVAAAAQGTSPAILLINELRIDQAGLDNDEYVELFSIPSNATLDGLTYLVIGDGAGASGTIESVVDLSGIATNAVGLALIAESTFMIGTATATASLNFENGDNVTHLVVADFTGADGDDLDTDDDGVLDVTPWTRVMDAVSLVETSVPILTAGEELFYAGSLGFTDVGPDGTFVPAHVFRCLTSLTDVRIGAFGLGTDDTAGGFNAPCVATTSLFCNPGSANSVSPMGGRMELGGSGSIQVNTSSLRAVDVPDTFGVFVQGDTTGGAIASPIGGNICLASNILRMNTVVVPSGNVAELPLDFSDAGLVEGSILAGTTLHYQFFHRDNVFPGGGNWTNGVSVTWVP